RRPEWAGRDGPPLGPGGGGRAGRGRGGPAAVRSSMTVRHREGRRRRGRERRGGEHGCDDRLGGADWIHAWFSLWSWGIYDRAGARKRLPDPVGPFVLRLPAHQGLGASVPMPT